MRVDLNAGAGVLWGEAERTSEERSLMSRTPTEIIGGRQDARPRDPQETGGGAIWHATAI
jgi:hypothetical protein